MKFRPGDHVVDDVDDALHGLLSIQDESYVKAHCETCPICSVAMTEAQKRLAALQTVPGCEAPESLIRSALVKIEEYGDATRRRRRLFWRITLPAVAAMLLILASLHLYYAILTPSNYDLRVLGQSQLLPGTEASLRAQLLYSGRPSAGAVVTIALEAPNGGRRVQLASFTTDAQGTGHPRFQLPDWPDGSYTLRVTARSTWDTQTITESVTLQREWRLMLSTDKPVYQPGQTIHLRSLALRRPDLKPVAGQEAVFAISDPNGNVIFKQTGVTSRYGLSSADCPLATEILEGAYTATCRIGRTESRATVEVKHYVLPKFKVDLSLDRPFYQPGQRVQAIVQADYFFGQRVAGATVELEARTRDVTASVLTKQDARTDAAGTAAFTFTLPQSLVGTEPNAGDARILITAKVRDIAGQEQSRARPATVTTSPIRIELIPESGQLVRGVANRVYVLTTYADGRPAQTQLAITGLTAPPGTSALGAAVFELTPNADQAELTVQASDSRGLVSRRTVQLSCGTLNEDFLVRSDQAVYHGGQTLHLQALGGGVEPIFVDLIKDGQTFLTQTMEMAGGTGTLALDLPPDLCGTLELVAYRYGAAGLPVRKVRILYVQPVNELQVKTALDRSEYRPGAPAKLSFQITDATGKPVPGALSLAAVDEAVYSVLEQAPGMERTFFTLEQKLLQPIYAIYPWSPDLDSAEPERQLLEQAVFAKAADQPTDRDALLQRMIQAGQISPRVLRSLNSPWGQRVLQQQLNDFDLPAEQKALLQSAGVHSLAHATGPENAERAAHIQRERLGWFPILWVLAGITVTLLLVFGISGLSGVVRAVLVLLILSCLVSVLLPSLGSARAFSSRAAMSADVTGLIKAMVVNNEDGATTGGQSSSAQVRVREFFPETLLWRPELITDENGRASLDLDLADSITTWRLSASAVSAAGQLGASISPIRVFQPFFVDVNAPVALTRGDEIALPVVVYNYLDKPQTVALTLDTPATGPQAWFELRDEAAKSITLQPAEVRSVTFRIRATAVGRHDFQITARAGEGAGAVADAVKRTVDVVPDGCRVEQVVSDTLASPADVTLTLPPEAIPGSVYASVKLYPSAFSQLVEGLDAVFQQPYGCFEQTSSTTYPNVLALAYLKQTGKAVPQVEATARQYIHLGYQRLVSFEISGGGFDWFGRPPANRTLTAYGLLEFQDMAKVHNVDPNLIARTRQWLLSQRNADGSWSAEPHMINDGLASAVHSGPDLDFATTAYTAWAVFQDGQARDAAGLTRTWLVARVPSIKTNPYTLALVANALLAMDPKDPDARVIAGLLDECKRSAADGKTCWWDQVPNSHTAFYGAGVSGNVETTALASLALLGTSQYPGTTRAALNWLITQKDPRGTWHSTQATVLALKALLAASGKPLGGQKPRQIALKLGHETTAQTVTIPADQADVMQSLDLTPRLNPGTTQVTLSDLSDAATAYQVRFHYYVPAPKEPTPAGPLSIAVEYDRADLVIGQALTATATLRNDTRTTIPMVIVDLPVPAGFALGTEDLEALRTAGTIAKYQFTPRSAIVYLRDLPAATPVVLRYHLKATMAVQLTVPPATLYEYYNPANRGQSAARILRVRAL